MINELGKKEIDIVVNAYGDNKLVVIPTDTIYGITCSAFNKKSVSQLYKIKKRDDDKPCIVLISNIKDIELFDVKLTAEQKKWLKKMWPEKLTVVLECNSKDFKYLHRGKKSLAFRIPSDKWLLKLISKTGPIIAPSANIQDCSVATCRQEAYDYFGDKVVYIDNGKLKGNPSTIVSFENEFTIIRKGSFKIKKDEYFRPSINN